MRHWRGSFPPPVKDTESKIIEDRQIGKMFCNVSLSSSVMVQRIGPIRQWA
ncbi:hypothetical protein GBA52_018527 [Prunus armeniaca]|nr:hypothetical protein GBA52_018527 [Prunus armeniaca]